MASKETEKLLEQLRDLIVLHLRQSKVPPEAIGKVLGVSAKSIRNRYPLGKVKGEGEEELTHSSEDDSTNSSQTASSP